MNPATQEIAASCHAAADTAGGDGLAALAILLAGLLGTIMPCTVQMAAVLSSLIARPSPDGAGAPPAGWLLRLGKFLGGYSATFIVAAGLAALVVRAAGWAVGVSALQVAGGLVLAAFGLQILGWIRLPGGGPCAGPVGFFLGRPWRDTPAPGRMGAAFAVYCAGCCGPAALGSAMLLTGRGSFATAGLLLLVYAVGMAVPFVLLAAGIAFALRAIKSAIRYTPLVSAAGGAVAVVAGAVLALEPVALALAG
jgi:cytochrome c-type biogenesis protein